MTLINTLTERPWRLLVYVLLFCVCSFSVADNKPQQSNLQKKISSANSKLKASKSTSDKLKRSVHKAEDKLNDITRKLHNTEQSINHLTTKLTHSNAQKRKLLSQTGEQKDALAQQMQALYTSGKQSHLRLLLRQDDPSDISRTIKYFEYMNDHRVKRIGVIKTRLDKIKKIQTQINEDTATLKDLQKKQGSRKKALKQAVKEKEKALKKQKRVVYSQQQQLAKLRKEEQRLQGVIRKLAEKRKREEQLRKKELAEAAKLLAKKKATPSKQNNKANKKPKSVVAEKKKESKRVERHYVPDKPFSSLRGKLSWPVRGRLTQRFNSQRNSKQQWKGVIISAAAGSNVHAVARGKVEFSGRLRGYGYLVIIRHDKNYRSLYAYNRSVYKKEGQVVKAGEPIAAVGSSGSQTNSGLYFEIRKGTTPQNPTRWIRR